MRKISSFVAIMLFSLAAWSQTYFQTYYPNAGNPGPQNNDANDAPGQAGWTNLVLGPQSANIWSPTVAIPFPFEFFGQPVTHFKASQNCVLTFDTLASLIPGPNASLPTPNLPDLSVAAFWDQFTNSPPTGSGDDIRYKVFGTAPNRQMWIKWYSFEIGNPTVSFVYMSIVLEEGTNRIFIVDQYSSTTPLMTATVGLQLNATTAIQAGSGAVAQGGNSGTATTDNDYYEFFPIVGAASDVAVTSVTVKPAIELGCEPSSVPVKIRVRNFGTSPATGIACSFSVNGGLPVTPQLIPGTLLPGDTISYTFTASALADLSTPGTNIITAIATVLGDGDNSNDTLSVSSVSSPPLTPTLPTVNFTGFTGANLSAVFPGWREAEGTTAPAGTTSGWVNDDFGNVVGGPNGVCAKFNLFNTGDNDWIISPRFDAGINTELRFDLALTGWNTTLDSAFGSDDFLKVMVSTDCGLTYTALATFDASTPVSNTGQSVVLSLAPYAGDDVIIGFYISEGTVDDPNDYDVFIDNIQIRNLSLTDMGVSNILAPEGAACFGSEPILVEIQNFGLGAIDFAQNNATLTVIATGANPNFYTTVLNSGILAVGTKDTILVTPNASFAATGTTTLKGFSSIAGDIQAVNDSSTRSVQTIPVVALPYTENFETFTPGTPGTLANGWTRTSTNSQTWYVSNTSTSSSNTGPTVDHSDPGSIFLFTEASGGVAGDVHRLVSPCFDLSATNAATLEFWYHMNGTDMGTLAVEVISGATTTQVFSLSGQQQPLETSPWLKATVDLTPFVGNTVQVVFKGTIGASFLSDMAIDDVYLFAPDSLNAAATAILSPREGDCGDSTLTGSLVVVNRGTNSLSNLPVKVLIGGALTDTFDLVVPGPLAYLASDTISFGPFNTAAGGNYTIQAFTQLPGDQGNDNDTTSISLSLRSVEPPAAQPLASSYCGGDTVTLVAISQANTDYAWYSQPVGGTPLASNDSLTVVAPASSTTYYLEASARPQNVGPVDNSFGAGAQYAFFSDGVIFDVLSDMSLISVRVYPGGPGDIGVSLKQGTGPAILADTFAFGGTVTDTVLTLNWTIPAGTGYSLTADGSTVSGLYRNSAGASYPYTLPNLVSLTGAVNNLAGYHYFFYDWAVAAAACPRPRRAVALNVAPLPTAAFSSSVSELTVSVSSNATGADSVFYSFGDGTGVFAPTASHTYADTGVYEVCQIAFSACGNDTTCVFVTATCNFPAAAFSFTTGDLSASFTSGATNADSVRYFFGDGASSNLSNPTHQYADTGSYEVCQVAYRFCGNDTLCTRVRISCAFAQAGFTFTTSSDSATFTSTALNADSVRYFFPGGASASGPVATFAFGASGLYPVTQVAYNICGTDTIRDTVSVIRSSLSGLLDAGSVKLYPNPTQGDFTLSLSLLQAAELQAELLNGQGQVVHSVDFGRVSGLLTHEFKVRQLAEGVYLLRVRANDESFIYKLRVE